VTDCHILQHEDETWQLLTDITIKERNPQISF